MRHAQEKAVADDNRECVLGVKRGMMGDDAKGVCSELQTVFVKESRGKADLTKYRQASSEVFQVLTAKCQHVERASVDEAFLDLTSLVDKRISEMQSPIEVPIETLPNTCVVYPLNEEGLNPSEISNDRQKNLIPFLELVNSRNISSNCELRLLIGAQIVEEIRLAVYERTEFRCSAGIAHNKILAKLACGINKPNKQTILPQVSVESFFATLPVHKLRYLGGKLGDIVEEELGCTNVGDLLRYSESVLTSKFGERNGLFLHNICRGINYEPVKPRTTVQSIGCSKNFLGKESIWTSKEVNHWTLQLCSELEERLNEDMDLNQRVFKLLTVNYSIKGRGQVSKRCPITSYDTNSMQTEVMKIILGSLPFKLASKEDRYPDPIIHLGTYASKAECATSANSSITNFFNISNDRSQIKFTKTGKDEVKETKIKKPKKSALDIFLDSKRVQKLKHSTCKSKLSRANNQNKSEENDYNQTKMAALSTLGSVNLSSEEIPHKSPHFETDEPCDSESFLFGGADLTSKGFEEETESEILVPESPPEMIRSFSEEKLNSKSSFKKLKHLRNFDTDYLLDSNIMSCTPINRSNCSLLKDFNISQTTYQAQNELVSNESGGSCLAGSVLEQQGQNDLENLFKLLFEDSESSRDSTMNFQSPQISSNRVSCEKMCLSEPATSKSNTEDQLHLNKYPGGSNDISETHANGLLSGKLKTPTAKRKSAKRKGNQLSLSDQKRPKGLKQAALVFSSTQTNSASKKTRKASGEVSSTQRRLTKSASKIKRGEKSCSQNHLKSSINETVLPSDRVADSSRSISSMFSRMCSEQLSVPDEIFEGVEGECDVMQCSLCGERVSMFTLIEHRDFHVAQKLQTQFNQRTKTQNTASSLKTTDTSKNMK
ncbi:DNA polymerase eta-like isoform X2 [Symsagittifera roscoffensis]|uniref:DNA polymerase eta-like isoform X2 n=1 Tax=Symsagittifera roscoffensis TaxID=84072 RepID=UPI00307BE67A